MVLVTTDLVGFDSDLTDEVRKRVGLSRGLAPEEVLINASHTHSAPTMRRWFVYSFDGQELVIPEYAAGVVDRITQAIEAAFDAMQLANLAVGTSTTHVCGYRRIDGTPLDADPSDKDHPLHDSFDPRVDVLTATTLSGARIATAFFTGCHAINMMWQRGISTDFPGATRDRLEAQKPGSVAFFFQGFGGDANPRNYFAAQRASMPPGVQPADDAQPDDPNTLADLRANMTSTATQLANDVAATQPRTVDGPVAIASTRAYLRDLTGNYLPTELELFTLGTDWALAASAHEVVSEYAASVRAQFPGFARGVTLAGYSNAVGSYIPTRRMISLPSPTNGYEPGSYYLYFRPGYPDWQDADLVSSGFGALSSKFKSELVAASSIRTGSLPAIVNAQYRSSYLTGTAAIADTERVDAFYRTTANQLMQVTSNGGRWTVPAGPLNGANGTLASDPVAVSWAPDRYDVFYRRTDGWLGQTYWNSVLGWTTYVHTEGATITSDPAAVSWGGTRGGPGRIDVVAVGTNGLLQHYSFDGRPMPAFWSFEQVPGSPQLRTSQRPVIVSSRAGRVEIYVRDVNDALRFVALNRQGGSVTWEPWKDLSNGLVSDPVAVAYAPGESLAFVRKADGNVYARGVSTEVGVFPSSSWFRFDGCGGSFGNPGGIVGALAAVSSAPGRVTLFARASSGNLCRWDLIGLSSGAPNSSQVAWQLTLPAMNVSSDFASARTTRGAGIAFHLSGQLDLVHWNEAEVNRPFELGNNLQCSFADERQCIWSPTDFGFLVPASGNPAGYARSDARSSVVFLDSAQHVSELALPGPGPLSFQTKWSLGDISRTAPTAASNPVAYVRKDSVNAVVYRSSDNHIRELSLSTVVWDWHPADLSTNPSSPAPLATGNPAAYVRSDGYSVVVFRGASNNHIYELALPLGGTTWQWGDLSQITSAPPAASDPVGYVRADGTNTVVFRSVNDNHVRELTLSGTNWSAADLSANASGAPPAVGVPRPYVRSDGYSIVVYRDSNNHIQELSLAPGATSWRCADLFTSLAAPAAASDPAPFVRSDTWNDVVYRGSDNHIHELALALGSTSWQFHDLSLLTGAPAATDTPSGYVRADGINAVVFRSSGDNHIRELWLSGTDWHQGDLTADAGGP
jgi:hypothetical protein